jgi:hypothetical protein
VAKTIRRPLSIHFKTDIMKISIQTWAILLMLMVTAGCDKDGNYPGGVVSPYIAIFDVRDQHKGSDVILTSDKLYGSSSISGVVVSDHSGGNMPDGLVILQDRRRLNELRGIAVDLGASAASYVPGDSLIIDVSGCKLTRETGILTIRGVEISDIKKVASGKQIMANRVNAAQVNAAPDKYESTFVILVKAGFNPAPAPADILSGDKILNDGFGDIRLHTRSGASFAGQSPAFLANYSGIIFNRKINDTTFSPQLQLRKKEDVVILSSTISVSPMLISGFISDVNGSDGNYEYMQFIATKDIDFSKTPFSVVITNNANASTPTGFPVNGWATGGMRTYKMNLTNGTVKKGGIFYVGGSNKMINGPSSTSISGANWIRAFDYTNANGDGFGTKTSGLFANSGNASGLAVFEGTNITPASIPVDVLFVGTGGSLYTTTPTTAGYRITNTDWYDTKNPVTLQDQPFYRAGTNTLNMSYTTSDRGFFYVMGGEYNVSLGRWTKARTQTNVLLTKTSQLTEIEGVGITVLK